MTVAELVEKLLDFDGDEKITFYFLKNDTLTNCQVEDINSYGMGIEFTIQDTSEVFRGGSVMNFSLEQNVDILSAYHVERFTYLRDNEQYQDADAIAQEYICNGEVENDNYQWLYVNYQFEEAN